MKTTLGHIAALRSDASSLQQSAELVNLAFAEDPLIQWLRPNASSGEANSTAMTKWQIRRLQKFQLYGNVLCLNAHAPWSVSTSSGDSEDFPVSKPTKDTRVAALALFEFLPSSAKWRRGLTWWLEWIKFRLSEIFDPAVDTGADLTRVEEMIKSHGESMGLAKPDKAGREICYLEVIAVHPEMQGRRFGREMMEAVLEAAGDRPIVLECTIQSNVHFYETFGFEVAREARLSTTVSGSDETVTTWFMIRGDTSSHKNS